MCPGLLVRQIVLCLLVLAEPPIWLHLGWALGPCIPPLQIPEGPGMQGWQIEAGGCSRTLSLHPRHGGGVQAAPGVPHSTGVSQWLHLE